MWPSSLAALLAALIVGGNSGAALAQAMKPASPGLINHVDQYFDVTAYQEADTECGDTICYYAAPITLSADSLTGVYAYSLYYYGSPPQAWHSEIPETSQGVAVTNAYDYFSDWYITTNLTFFDSNGYKFNPTQGINATNCSVGVGTAVNCGYTFPYFNMYDYQGRGIVDHHENIIVDDDLGVDDVWAITYEWHMTSFCNYSPYNCW